MIHQHAYQAEFTKKTTGGECAPTRRRGHGTLSHRSCGSLSATNMPQFKGLEKLGQWYHTSRYPHSGVDLPTARSRSAQAPRRCRPYPKLPSRLSTSRFQRTANYCVPARNGKVTPKWSRRERRTNGVVDNRIVLRPGTHSFRSRRWRCPKREREFDRMWTWWLCFRLANYQDMSSIKRLTIYAPIISRKIRKTVKDPVVAES
jgi:cyclohexanone monooxygenase